jgi:hypothetical protein
MLSNIQEISTLITPDNWTFCYFKMAKSRALISIGADTESDEFIYYSSVLDEKDMDIYQKEFNSLDSACQFINQNYSDWEFVNQLKSDDSDGCSSCSAH